MSTPRYDLHTHSSVSDGTETPAELLAAAAVAGLDGLALTDHDTNAGWDEAADAARAHGLLLVRGMEMSCRTDEGVSVHLLSYLHDPEDDGLNAEMARARDARVTRAQMMAERLSEDFDLTWDDVLEHTPAGATIGRPHLADALVRIGAVPDRTAAFQSILTGSSKYYVPHYAPHPADAVRLVRAAGGVPVFAHPLASARGRVVGMETFEEMIAAGLGGLEVDHRDNPDEARAVLRGIAERHGLFTTGSSDYHGTGKPNRLGENLTAPEALAEIERQATGTVVLR